MSQTELAKALSTSTTVIDGFIKSIKLKNIAAF